MTYGGGLSDIASGQAPRSRHIRLVTNTLAAGKPLTEQGEESDNPLAGIMFVDTRQLRIQPFEPCFAFALHDRTDESLFRTKMTKRLDTSTVFSKARSRPICRCSRPP